VGLRHSGEYVRANFGHEPFKFDIDYHVQQQQGNVWTKILATPLDSSLLDVSSSKGDRTADSTKMAPLTDGQKRDVINKLVLSYLEHHGYANTMRTFQKQLGGTSADRDRDIVMADGPSKAVDSNDMERRIKTVNSVISGDIDTVISDAKTHYPAVLEAEAGLMLFKLRCRKFVELILAAAELKKRMRNRSVSRTRGEDDGVVGMDGIDEDWTGMEVDEEGDARLSPPAPSMNGFSSAGPGRRRTSRSPGDAGGGLGAGTVDGTAARYEVALNQAISYGQTLSKAYKDDERPEVKEIFKRTFAIVAWEDPMTAGGLVSEVVGQEARVVLANELNKAILSECSGCFQVGVLNVFFCFFFFFQNRKTARRRLFWRRCIDTRPSALLNLASAVLEVLHSPTCRRNSSRGDLVFFFHLWDFLLLFTLCPLPFVVIVVHLAPIL